MGLEATTKGFDYGVYDVDATGAASAASRCSAAFASASARAMAADGAGSAGRRRRTVGSSTRTVGRGFWLVLP